MRHLTEIEIDGMVMGAEETDACALHVAACDECRAKVMEMRVMLGSFREGILSWEPAASGKTRDGILSDCFAQALSDRGRGYSWMAMPAIGLAAALVLGVMMPRWIDEHRVSHEAAAEAVPGEGIEATAPGSDGVQAAPAQAAPAQAAADEQLMNQVEQQVDADVPDSMAPLTALIQTESPRANSRKKLRQEREN